MFSSLEIFEEFVESIRPINPMITYESLVLTYQRARKLKVYHRLQANEQWRKKRNAKRMQRYYANKRRGKPHEHR